MATQPTHNLVNAARLPDHVGQTVRLTGLVLLVSVSIDTPNVSLTNTFDSQRKAKEKELLVKASDDGKVLVALNDVCPSLSLFYAVYPD